MRIAGAYNLGFFIFIFYFFKLLCVQKGETAMNHTPVYTFGLGYPPMTKQNLFIIQKNSKHNEKN